MYKITAYHCPACGGATKPTSRYCNYCGRDLGKRLANNHGFKARFLIDCGNFIYFDNIHSMDIHEEAPDIDCIRDANGYLRRVYLPPQRKYDVNFLLSERAKEFLDRYDDGIHKTRIEIIYGKTQLAFESDAYITRPSLTFNACGDNINLSKIHIIECGDSIRYNTAIPDKIVSQMRCPNCGAVIKSKFGACDYCSGWSEVEW